MCLIMTIMSKSRLVVLSGAESWYYMVLVRFLVLFPFFLLIQIIFLLSLDCNSFKQTSCMAAEDPKHVYIPQSRALKKLLFPF